MPVTKKPKGTESLVSTDAQFQKGLQITPELLESFKAKLQKPVINNASSYNWIKYEQDFSPAHIISSVFIPNPLTSLPSSIEPVLQIAEENSAKLEAAQPKAGVQVKHPDGSVVDTEEQVGGPTLFKEPPCTVGFKLGCTVPIAPYMNAKAEVWISVPCAHGEIDQCYEFAKGWVEKRMETVSAEIAANADKMKT